MQPTGDGDGATLLADGTGLVERPGRLIWEKGKPVFVFIMQEGGSRLQSMELLPNQLLEALEQEAERGISEFVISARVTRYKGRTTCYSGKSSITLTTETYRRKTGTLGGLAK